MYVEHAEFTAGCLDCIAFADAANLQLQQANEQKEDGTDPAEDLERHWDYFTGQPEESRLLYRGVARMVEEENIYDQKSVLLFSSYTLAAQQQLVEASDIDAQRAGFAEGIRTRMVNHLDVPGRYPQHWDGKNKMTFSRHAHQFQQRYSGSMDGFYEDIIHGLAQKRRGTPFPVSH